MKRLPVVLVLLGLPAVLLGQEPNLPTVGASDGGVDGGVADAAVEAPPPPDPAATAAFLDVAKVLQSPRCMNCHPADDVPTVGDDAQPHPMHVRRGLERVGMSCQTCHRQTSVASTERLPPALTGWTLPPKEMPMPFQQRTPSQLCAQLKDPAQNGGKDLAALLHHVEEDALVLYGWNPGGGRTVPPLSHKEFVDKFRVWVAAGAPCP